MAAYRSFLTVRVGEDTVADDVKEAIENWERVSPYEWDNVENALRIVFETPRRLRLPFGLKTTTTLTVEGPGVLVLEKDTHLLTKFTLQRNAGLILAYRKARDLDEDTGLMDEPRTAYLMLDDCTVPSPSSLIFRQVPFTTEDGEMDVRFSLVAISTRGVRQPFFDTCLRAVQKDNKLSAVVLEQDPLDTPLYLGREMRSLARPASSAATRRLQFMPRTQ